MSYQPDRRLFIKGILATSLLMVTRVGLAASAQVVAIRIWPSSTYTRITIESSQALQYKQLLLPNPERLVLDIPDLYLGNQLKKMNSLVKVNDPYIKQIRVAQYNTQTVRLVIELKQKINPSIFDLKPVSEFRYRFVIDLYPLIAAKDEASLAALLETFNSGQLSKEQSDIKLPERKSGPFIVMLDPGHGGEDPGAMGYYRTREKDIVLQIARRLRTLLQNESKIKVYMTRNEDIFIPLQVRVAKARSLHADIFISIHADAFTQRSAQGASVYMLSTSGSSSSIAKYLAQTQNESNKIGGVSRSGDRYLDHTLLDMVRQSTITNSDLLGTLVIKNLERITKMHKRRIEKAGFAVLKAPDIPSILVETAFISNLDEEARLRTAKFQNQVANAIYQGVKNYIRLRKR